MNHRRIERVLEDSDTERWGSPGLQTTCETKTTPYETTTPLCVTATTLCDTVTYRRRRQLLKGGLIAVISLGILLTIATLWSELSAEASEMESLNQAMVNDPDSARVSDVNVRQKPQPLHKPLTVADILREAKRQKMMKHCSDKSENCSHWASTGRCNSGYMRLNCGVSCNTCEYATLPYAERCSKSEREQAIRNNDLYNVFRRAATLSQWGAHLVHQDPPVVVFDQLLSQDEVNKLVALGHEAQFKRSTNTVQDRNLQEQHNLALTLK